VYAGSAEIKEYYKSFADKHRLNRYVRLNSKVSDATWDEANGRWSLKIEDTGTGETFTDSCDILINGSGILNNWQWPAIESLDTFQGTLLHSANYDRETDLKGKRVGLIGNG
jgi:cation diffusion facilitator CzcD-associated flavoprotein CzcO